VKARPEAALNGLQVQCGVIGARAAQRIRGGRVRFSPGDDEEVPELRMDDDNNFKHGGEQTICTGPEQSQGSGGSSLKTHLLPGRAGDARLNREFDSGVKPKTFGLEPQPTNSGKQLPATADFHTQCTKRRSFLTASNSVHFCFPLKMDIQ